MKTIKLKSVLPEIAFKEEPSQREKELTFILVQILDSLPSNKDWLDPAIEDWAKKLVGRK